MNICICDILQSAYTGAFLQLVEGDDGINVEATTEADLETFFHRVNNAFIHELEFGGFCQESHRRLCRFLATANSLQCQIGALRIEVSKEGIDYALIEFLGVHLKPHTYEVSMIGKLREDYVMLFTHEALRGSVRHLVCEVSNALDGIVNQKRSAAVFLDFCTVCALPSPVPA